MAHLGDPVSGLFDRPRIERDAVNASVALSHEQAGFLQNAKMLRHRWQRHVERLRELADCPLTERESGEDRAAGGIAERGEGGIERIGIVNQLV
jgi:L-serine deaminase